MSTSIPNTGRFNSLCLVFGGQHLNLREASVDIIGVDRKAVQTNHD